MLSEELPIRLVSAPLASMQASYGGFSLIGLKCKFKSGALSRIDLLSSCQKLDHCGAQNPKTSFCYPDLEVYNLEHASSFN